MNLELRYLPAFRAVCETGSLRAAAAVMHRTEQALSYQLKRLEERLGTTLFDRGVGRLVPNARGKRLLDFCRDMHRDWSRVLDELDDPADGDTLLRIAAVSGFGRYVLLPMFRDGPLAEVPLRMHYPAAPQVMRSVAEGTADLGFVHCPQPSGPLACEVITEEELVLVAPAGVNASPLEQLPAQSFVTYDESDYVFATWFARVSGTATPILRCTAHFEELEEVLEWVADGRGLSIAPADCAAAAVADGKLALLRWPGRRCSNAIYAVRDPAVTLPSAAETLLHLLRTREGMALSVA